LQVVTRAPHTSCDVVRCAHRVAKETAQDALVHTLCMMRYQALHNWAVTVPAPRCTACVRIVYAAATAAC
jgi:hypothetical protein